MNNATNFSVLTPDGKVTNSVTVNIHSIPSDDPLAYAYGFSKGLRGEPRDKADPWDSLAPAYKKGHAHGLRVKKGKEKPPAWAEVPGSAQPSYRVTGLVPKNLLPFMGVQFDKTVSFKEKGQSPRKFRVITYQAYNALGLIGSECNGVAILDEDKKLVLCDEILKQDTGWFGASDAQVAEATRICFLPWKEFQAFVNTHPRTRHKV